ncbi:hypothetical protein EON63_04585 [archaeon]|nr:MAG: hypothetical protein EON63_04585 [archaeon]
MYNTLYHIPYTIYHIPYTIHHIPYTIYHTPYIHQVAVSDFLTLFSARAGPDWFYTSSPSMILCVAASIALCMSTCIACVWPLSRPDGIPCIGLERRTPYILPVFIWGYCLIWWIIQVRVCVCACTYTHIHTHIFTHIHTHTHTHRSSRTLRRCTPATF